MTAESGCAATHDRAHHLQLLETDSVSITVHEVAALRAKDVGHRHASRRPCRETNTFWVSSTANTPAASQATWVSMAHRDPDCACPDECERSCAGYRCLRPSSGSTPPGASPFHTESSASCNSTDSL